MKQDWDCERKRRELELGDYVGAVPRWCSCCGDHSILRSLQRLARDEKLPPEKMVIVSGIGCSSRFPHYMKTYGFHGLHGRPLPVACGVRARRPDLHIFVVTGDGDCCAIGTAHWIHALRYNMNMTVMMLDNNVYGLTKMQSSPTTPQGVRSNTHPFGSPLPPLNPLTVTLGVTNASFVAQTVDWNPPHVHATIRAAHRHKGFSFVRILQRCPHYMPDAWNDVRDDPESVLRLTHAKGVTVEGPAAEDFPNTVAHDPGNLDRAREFASRTDVVPVGLFYLDEAAPSYDGAMQAHLEMDEQEKIDGVRTAIERFAI